MTMTFPQRLPLDDCPGCGRPIIATIEWRVPKPTVDAVKMKTHTVEVTVAGVKINHDCTSTAPIVTRGGVVDEATPRGSGDGVLNFPSAPAAPSDRDGYEG